MDLVEMLFNNAMNAEGGGGGDLSTATLTIVNNMSESEAIFKGSFAFGDGEESASYYEDYASPGTQKDASVILYKGYGVIRLDQNPSTVNVTLDGDITTTGEGMYMVTGDCTLTVADK